MPATHPRPRRRSPGPPCRRCRARSRGRARRAPRIATWVAGRRASRPNQARPASPGASVRPAPTRTRPRACSRASLRASTARGRYQASLYSARPCHSPTSTGSRSTTRSTGSGEPLLCVMGLAADHLAWALQLEAFAARHRTIVFDNRDVGQSSLRRRPVRDRRHGRRHARRSPTRSASTASTCSASRSAARSRSTSRWRAPERVRTLHARRHLGRQRRLRAREDAAVGVRAAAARTPRTGSTRCCSPPSPRSSTRTSRWSTSSSRSCAPTRTRRSPRASSASPSASSRHDLRGRLAEPLACRCT